MSMNARSLKLFRRLVEAPSPSGYERPAADVMREIVKPYATRVHTDVMGSVHAHLEGSQQGVGAERTTVLVAGHIDEVGLMVTYLMSDGYLAFKAIGGVDAAILPGMRVDVHTESGVLRGVLGRLPIHLLDEDERKTVTKLHRLFIDLGLPAKKVKEQVRVGDPITFAVGFEEFGDGMAVSRAFDDKMGAFICAETLRRVHEAGGARVDLVVAGTVQEEIGMRGGITTAYGVDPTVGIAVEVGHATDYPDVDKRRHGEAVCGHGPIITRGANINPVLFKGLIAAAKAAKVKYQIDGEPRGTGTDANAFQIARGGKAAALVSVPLRYMHTPTEVLSLADVDAASKLLARYILDLEPGCDFTP